MHVKFLIIGHMIGMMNINLISSPPPLVSFDNDIGYYVGLLYAS